MQLIKATSRDDSALIKQYLPFCSAINKGISKLKGRVCTGQLNAKSKNREMGEVVGDVVPYSIRSRGLKSISNSMEIENLHQKQTGNIGR